MKCNLIVPGFAKCGTSSLHEYLNLHPQICMSSSKEPHYFSFKERMDYGASWHDGLFKDATVQTKVFGESSTTYSVWEPALVRIKQEIENPKVIILLREPLERLMSHYRWMYALGLEYDSLSRALKRERNAPVHPDFNRSGCYPWYRRCSNYAHFIPLMQFVFGTENVLIIKTEELSQEPRVTLGRCFEFLDLEAFDIGPGEMRTNETASKEVPWGMALSRYYHLLPQGLRGRLASPKDSLIKLLGKRKLVAPTPSAETIQLLEGKLREDRLLYESL